MSSEAHELFNKLQTNPGTALVKIHLTKKIFDELLPKKTKLGGDLALSIRSGALNPDSLVGLYASDPEAYDVFNAIFEPVLKGFHLMDFSKPLHHPTPDFGDINNLGFGNLDPEGKMIISSRVRVARCHANYPFPPVTSFEQRMEMERMTVEALKKLPGELAGTYYPLPEMTEERKQQLIKDHFLFSDKSRFREVVHGFRDWPHGRGIFLNPTNTFLVWVNEGDHMRFVSMQKGGDVGQVYKRLATAVRELEKSLTFSVHPKLGYLAFCPTNIGTSMRASVHIHIPKVEAAGKIEEICKKYNLQPRGIYGEHTQSEGSVYDISNQRRLGLTEFQAISEMVNGVKELIQLEKSL